MKVSAILPMKAHSERVKNKNMRIFNGRPLYHKIANELLKAKSVKNIYINTDSDEIIKDVKKTFPMINLIVRPKYLRGDLISMNKIIEYDIKQIDSDHFIQTHSTNPLVKAETIDNAIQKYFNYIDKYDSLFSVTELKTRLYDASLRPINHNPKELIRTQDLPSLFEENSNFYIFSKHSFNKSSNKRIGKKPNLFVVDKIQSIDIDEEDDFFLAEIIDKFQST